MRTRRTSCDTSCHSQIISGGQTGADRGGLDAAIELGLPQGGWCPRGRRAEDGEIPKRYKLRETASSEYVERTELNVKSSDGTVIFSSGPLEGGSAYTADMARTHNKPLLHIDLATTSADQAEQHIATWVSDNDISILNVAGSRESKAPGIQRMVMQIVAAAMRRVHGMTKGR